jgi:hypothetical protein
MKGLAVAAAIVLASPVVLASTASASVTTANAAIVWDANAQTAIWDVGGQQPNVQGRSFAMVSGAVYDAVNAIAGTPYQPYLGAPPASGSESPEAAVATAAFQVLTSLFPAQQDRLRAQYDEFLAGIPDGRARRGGIAVGGRAAAAMIAARHDDGAFGPQTWVVGTEPGQWRPTPPLFGSDSAWSGHVRPFFLPRASIFRTAGPPALTSREYAKDLNEVKLVGAASSTARTADQTEAAIWWHDRRSTSWEIKRQLATTQRLSLLQTARMFAMVDFAGAEAGIACFAEKEAWSFWRPVTAVQLADTDGNPRTSADPTWMPLLVTPPFPEYTSGHACGTGARMSAYRAFFGRDGVPFSASSVDTGTTRHFEGFSEALTELVHARVWGGVHFRTADVEGARLGAKVTAYMTAHHFGRL